MGPLFRDRHLKKKNATRTILELKYLTNPRNIHLERTSETVLINPPFIKTEAQSTPGCFPPHGPPLSGSTGQESEIMPVARLCPTLCDHMDLQPTRLLCPQNFPSKNTGTGCYFLSWGFSRSRDLTFLYYIHMFFCLLVSNTSDKKSALFVYYYFLYLICL